MGGGNPLPVSPKTYVIDVVRVVPLSITDENGHVTTMTYDNATTVTNFLTGRIKTKTLDGTGSNYTTYNYDTRSNITSMVLTPKAGTTGTLTTSATYPADPCANAATCNLPITTTDSAGQVTNYYYNTNGTLNYVQSPALSTGVRPEVHYTYVSGQAQVVSSSGATVSQGDVVTLPTGTTACTTGAYASCASANLVTNLIGYPGGSTPTNFLPITTSVQSGNGVVNSTTTVAYDNVGNVTSVSDPVGNISTATYTMDRQPVLAVGPSVDGSSTSARGAVQYQYSLDGLPATVTAGSYNPSTQALTPSVVTTTSYDILDRPITRSVSDGTTTYALTQYNYNGVGQPDCVAVRMNPAAFNSLPASACTLGTQGSDGPDRISEYWYDQTNKVIAINSALGVSGTTTRSPAYSFNNHNLPTVMSDGLGNATVFNYDGYDRLVQICYQGGVYACQAGTATDYVNLTYDAAGRLASRSLRGTPTSLTTYGYDNLSRLTSVTYPGGGTYDKAVTTTYDNLNRPLSATDAAGDSVAYTYDALGDVLTEADANSTRTMAYDAAGRRTQLTWSDGRYVTYQYNGTSAVSTILESGSTTLVSYGYDTLGRRTSLTRGNGVVTSYSGYTPLGATAMAITLPTTANNLSLTFAFNAAGQIKSRTSTSSNLAWFYQGYYNITRSYTVNALNQYATSGSVTPTYDAKGNLISAGSAVYGYSSKNELVTSSDTGSTFYHDPVGRLDKITTSPTSTLLQYNGPNILTEVDGGSGTLLRRYVHGAGTDEPLVWYEGTDFSNKRYMIADERGSIIAVTDASGNPLAFNTYDEYGIPPLPSSPTGNVGRFQYTGQAWIKELGMYSYKARIYSPTMGRFLQTDPGGYPNGPDWYAYAGNDPINIGDPTGMDPYACDGSSSDCAGGIIASTQALGQYIYRVEPTIGPDPNSVYANAYLTGYNPDYASGVMLNIGISNNNYIQGMGPMLFGIPNPARATATPQSSPFPCHWSANDKLSIGLDAVGLGASVVGAAATGAAILGGAAVATAVAPVIVGAAAIGVVAAIGSFTVSSFGTSNADLAYGTGGLTGAIGLSFVDGAEKGFSRVVPGIGVLASGLLLKRDINNANSGCHS